MKNEQSFIKGSFTSFCYDDVNRMFLCITNDCLLMEISECDLTSRYLYPIEGNTALRDFLAYDAIFYKGKFFYFHYNGTRYIVYDSNTNSLKEYSFSEIDPTSWDEKKNIVDVKVFDGKCYVFFRTKKIIGIINLDNEMDVRTVNYNIAGDVYFAFKQTNYEYVLSPREVKVFNYVTGEVEKTNISNFPLDLQDVFVSDDETFFLSDTGAVSVYRGDCLINRIVMDCNNGDFSLIVPAGDKIWIFPKFGSDIVYIIGEKVIEYKGYDEDFGYCVDENWLRIGYKYTNYVVTQERIYFPIRIGNKMCSIEKRTGDIRWDNICFPSNKDRMNLIIQENEILYESNSAELRDFVDALC